ncbi:MAG: DNA-binding protein WhiA [Phascolarctobacterium sp.]|nr:DNA-binding protein WhiA [Phascolarctobacterium sp.]
MSFSNDVKNELARIEDNTTLDDKAELLGLLRMSGAIVIRGMNIGIHFSTENAALARRALQLLKSNYNVQTEVMITRSRRLKKNNRYQVRVLPSRAVRDTLDELQLLSMDTDLHNPIIKDEHQKRAYLRGAFMGGGSVSRPSSDYHLEMVTENETFARALVKILHGFHLKAKLTDRKDDYIVYMKEAESIIDFLSFVGAHNARCEMENVRIVKSLRNDVNRAVNCETANLNKVVKAAMRQVECIKFLDEKLGLSNLPKNLEDTARLRLQYPDVSLNDLVEYSGGIGKSGINHRLKKLQEMAVELGVDAGEKHD